MEKILFWLSRKINYPLILPERIQISLTYRCNLRCKMCSIVNLLPPEEELSTQQIFHIIDEAKDYRIKEVILTGGEPFLRNDIFEICNYCYEKGITSVITTNGVLIDTNLAGQIAQSRINHIHLSLDGLEGTNDFFRGEGLFNKIINAIDCLNKRRFEGSFLSIGIACTVMNKNVGELYEIVKLADNLKVDVINFQPLCNDNKNFTDTKISEFWIKRENIGILGEQIKKIKSYKAKHIIIQQEPDLELLLKYYNRNLTTRDWVCFGGFKTVFMCYAKNQPLVYSCHGVCGNLEKISLRAAWISKEAYRLRIHSKNCQNLCLQSCYSKEDSQSLYGLLKAYKSFK